MKGPRRRFEVRAYLGPDLHARVCVEAAARRQSLSHTVRAALTTYYTLSDEVVTAFDSVEPTSANEGRRTVTHKLLGETEERLAATIDRQAERISRALDRLDLLAAMVDQLYLGLMVHLPEVPSDLRRAAVANGQRRHSLWRRAVVQLLEEGGIGTPKRT